ncbi:MAG TPA: zinc-binding dehydrogenase [Steroidobacteraceae bacterium]|nr:zinc-binding dehydrogenase [Steroidobacteraceae bacterium]
MSAALAQTRAACFNGSREVTTVDVPLPLPGPRQVRVRLEGCGVCASNLPVWEGRPWFAYPFPAGAPGHEGWGRIDAVGADVADLVVGDRVAMVSGKAYARHDIADADAVVRIPAALAGLPVPGEPLGCAMNIFRRSDIVAGQTVAIVGIGFLGALLTGLCVRAGARVIAISRRHSALLMAEHFGASSCVTLSEPAQTVREALAFCGDGCECVIEAVGTQDALDVASALTGVRARLVIAGYHQDGRRSVDMQRWNWLGLDVVNAHERDPLQYRRGMQEALERVAAGTLDPTPLYTHIFPLEETAAAFRTLAERPDGFFKALIDCQ